MSCVCENLRAMLPLKEGIVQCGLDRDSISTGGYSVCKLYVESRIVLEE